MARTGGEVASDGLTASYARYLNRLIRPSPNWDFFFIRSLRRRAVQMLELEDGDRVLDAGCGPGGTFPYLLEAVGPTGEVVGIEISPETTINARRRIAANNWKNVEIVLGDARTVELDGIFDGLVMFAAPDVYASPQALANLISHLKRNARVAVFGAKLSNHRLGAVLNLLFRSLMKLSFRSTPAMSYEPLSALKRRLVDVHMEEHFFGSMFLAWGTLNGQAETVERSSGKQA